MNIGKAALPALGVMLAMLSPGSAQSADSDSLTINNVGGINGVFPVAEADNETGLNLGPFTPPLKKKVVVELVEPDNTTPSDVLYTDATGARLLFVSDGANDLNALLGELMGQGYPIPVILGEGGGPLQVGDNFGANAGDIVVSSDVDVPLPLWSVVVLMIAVGGIAIKGRGLPKQPRALI